MDETKVTNICRACMCTDGTMKPMFISEPALASMLMSCTNVTISEVDGLPGQICESCEISLHSAFLFKQQCERSDVELR